MALTYHRARWPEVTPTHQQYGIVARQRTSIGFKLVVRGDSGAGGLVAPLPCIDPPLAAPRPQAEEGLAKVTF